MTLWWLLVNEMPFWQNKYGGIAFMDCPEDGDSIFLDWKIFELYTIDWLLVTDISRQHISSIFKGQAVQEDW